MTLLVPWLVFPLVLGVVALGCGLVLERAAAVVLPGPLLVPAGLAVIIVADELATATAATAPFAVPLVVALAVGGLASSVPRLRGRIDRAALGAALLVFLAYGAPVLATGAATFTGYIKLDDTATWLGFTDRLMEHGRSLAGLAPSTYSALLRANLSAGYPTGSFFPLGVGHALTQTDSAWLFQPYLAFLGAILALSLYSLAAPLVPRRPARAFVAVVAALPALLYGYSLWGGIKEMVAACLLALTAASFGPVLGTGVDSRAALPAAVATSAVLASLSLDSVIWLAPLLFVVAAGLVASAGRSVSARRLAGFAIAALVFSAPVLAGGVAFARIDSASNELLRKDTLGNLIRPLDTLQVFGIWPTGDFRVAPTRLDVTYVLICVVGLAVLVGAAAAIRRRAWLIVAYAVVTVGTLVVVDRASPWVGGKALATASPVPILLGLVGAIVLLDRGRRVEAVLLAVAITGGVFWSDALAYDAVTIAPRDQLVELEHIGSRFAGEGPTLENEYGPYGARHFLRAMDAETPSELRARPVFLRNGSELQRGQTADLDVFRLDQILVYRTLVLRRSGVASRPPSVYSLVWRGRYYDVWQRPDPVPATILEHLPLGSRYQPGAVPRCTDVLRLARLAGAAGALAFVPRADATTAELSSSPYATNVSPYSEDPRVLYLRRRMTLDISAAVTTTGAYDVWLGGSFPSQLHLFVDGRTIGSRRGVINWPGQFTPFGSIRLAAGTHRIELRYSGRDALRPGSGAVPINGAGPVVLSRVADNAVPVQFVAPARARTLCGKRLDWIEALGA